MLGVLSVTPLRLFLGWSRQTKRIRQATILPGHIPSTHVAMS